MKARHLVPSLPCLGSLGLSILGVLSGCSPTPTPKAHLDAPAGHWIRIFDGQDLNGWIPKVAGAEAGENYRNTFRVAGNVLRVSYEDYDTFGDHFGSLYYNKRLSRYWLKLQYRFVGEKVQGAPGWAYKNSGIQLHSQAPETLARDQRFPVSVEFDLVGGRFVGSRPTGDVCHNGTSVTINGVPLTEQCSKVSDVTVRDESWVSVLAKVDGATVVQQAINGNLIVEYSNLKLDERDPDARRLITAGAGLALDSGFISLQSNGAPIEFRDIEILPIDSASVPAT